jgi:hypothetical protein
LRSRRLGFDPADGNVFFVPPPGLDVLGSLANRRKKLTAHIRSRRETASKMKAAMLRSRMSHVGRKVSAVGAFAGGSKRRLMRKTLGAKLAEHAAGGKEGAEGGGRGGSPEAAAERARKVSGASGASEASEASGASEASVARSWRAKRA